MGRTFHGNAPSRTAINYSQFMEQLGAGNIRSVSIKKELVTGEFLKETSVPQSGRKETASQVKYFQTVLPSFQGEGLLSQLKEKNVIISIESAEQGWLWQLLVGVLPWVLIIGFWIFMTKRNQQMQGGPGGPLALGQARPNCLIRKNRA